jgi:CRP-like cAMP-binding protein
MHISDKELELVRQTALFGGLDERALASLLADASICRISSGEILFLQGDTVEACFIMLDGWVKLYRVSSTGEEAVVAVFTRGQSFAEAAAFTDGKYPVNCEAVADARVLHVPCNSLLRQIRENPDIGLAMLASTSLHLHDLVRQVEQLKTHTGVQRVAGFLASLCPVEEGACTIGLPYDKALIASRLGMKPESLSRSFARLRSIGVRVERGVAAVSDIGRLKDYAEGARGYSRRSEP